MVRVGVVVLVSISFAFVFPKSINASIIYFQDNFNDNDISDWTVARNMQWSAPSLPCLYQSNPTTWKAENGRVGIKIDGPGCVTELIPNNFNFTEGMGYSYSFDMEFTNTVIADRNIIFKYLNPSNWYDLKFYGSDMWFQKVVDGYYRLEKSSYSFQDNQTYHFRIEFSNIVIKIFINDIQVWELADSPPYFGGGTIGFQASVGTDPDSEVWFDNVVVRSLDPVPTPTPTPTPLTPIILIPGMGAGWNYEALVHGVNVPDTDWKIAPYVKVYNGLISALEAAGYIQNTNLWVYAYDWRRNASDTANNLAQFISDRISSGQVNLVGHSLGGLVARAYAQSNPEKIDKLLTVGSPHRGVGEAFYLWEGANPQGFTGWQKLAMKLLLRVNRDQYDTEVAEVQALFPALRNVLPIYEFLKNRDGSIKPIAGLTWTNNFLPGLDSQLGSILAKLQTLSSNWGNTVKFIQVEPRSLADILTGRWVDGKPTGQKEYDNGDGAVLLSSSQISGAPVNDELSGKNHTEIISKEISQKKILEMLGLPASGQDVNQPNYDSAIIVTTASPVDFQVSGPGGTFLPEDGIVVISNPADGDYQVTVSPAGGGGNYTLYFGRIKGDDEAWQEVSDSVASGQTDQHQFGVQLSQANLGDTPLDNAQARLETLKTAVGASALKLPARRILLQDLARIKSYVADIGQTKVNTAAKFDARMNRLYRTIDALVAKTGRGPWADMAADLRQQIKEGLRLVKQDVYQQRADQFAN
ncbi:MAG: Triacylglycerol lipase [Candidatus Amesbacteria bacterium GW2011_GWA1_46_35]|uniref:Triacylglycerol lipase n=1 Tax=Candidatus Amesbacteria bacterium GW2011_GWC2_45_19 TaxID=1618366 RepID=A0A0G1Q3N1_9BACT|nr:MAG: Triacylglycerol lipase [Candidatus Amesbacteria bacterium GW2011_GWC2_45_19]KKU37466.1 MAG: Triacylglycerol lipase [Candidatus Amesbacteria bacterium GW2011_GWA1_46_35]KKU69432.1 MAG: Triacylglycerol lipase [Microgenomates group bacterium GW2011_GWC1_47_20]